MIRLSRARRVRGMDAEKQNLEKKNLFGRYHFGSLAQCVIILELILHNTL
jgi:hypothetical protein